MTRTETLVAIPPAALITLGLLATMHALLAQRVEVPRPPEAIPIDWIELVAKPKPPTNHVEPVEPIPEVLPITAAMTVRGKPAPETGPIRSDILAPPSGNIGGLGEHAIGKFVLLDNSAPVLLRRAKVMYPPVAARKSLSGHVDVRFDITAAGTVENAVVTHATDPVFVAPALRAIERFRYRPRYVNGEPAHTTGAEFRIRFDFDAGG